MCDRIGIINNGKLIRICMIDELTNHTSQSSVYRIKTSDPKKAAQTLSESSDYKVSNATEDTLVVEVGEEGINDCVRKIVEAGSDILGVQKVESSLEEAFLEITGGGIDIA